MKTKQKKYQAPHYGQEHHLAVQPRSLRDTLRSRVYKTIEQPGNHDGGWENR